MLCLNESAMQKEKLSKLKLPDAPGVYFFIGPKGKILYIGKATSLRDRVRSYFSNDLIKTRGVRIVDMVTNAVTVKFEETDSVLEALILEAKYIKKHQPSANSFGKDDKSYNYVVITKEDFPRVLLVRGKDLATQYPNAQRKYLFGPFPHGGQLKEALKIIRKIFPFFDTRKPITDIKNKHDKGKIIFNQQIGLYPHADNEFAKKEYARTINHLRLFFEGKKKALLAQLDKEMQCHAVRQEFEQAAVVKRQIFALQHIQDVSLLKAETQEYGGRTIRIEAYDIAHLSGKAMTGVMTVVENGQVEKNQYRKFKIRTVNQANDTAALKEVIERRLGHDEWLMPNLIVVDGGKAQINAAEKVLKESGVRIPVVSVVKDERHRPRELLGNKTYRDKYERDIVLANAEAHLFAIKYHDTLRRKFA